MKMTQDEALMVLLDLRSAWNADMTARAFSALAAASELYKHFETASGSWDPNPRKNSSGDGFWCALALLAMSPRLGIRLVEELREMAEPELER